VVSAATPARPALSSALHRSFQDIERWAKPTPAGGNVEAFLAAQSGGRDAERFPAGCAAPPVVEALARQVAIQRTVARSRLAVDAFGTRAFRALAPHAAAAVVCVEGALSRLPDREVEERVELIRLLARLAPGEASSEQAKALLQQEAARSVLADSPAAPGPVYALHAYLSLEADLAQAGETVRRAVRAQADPAMRAALREVVSRRFSGLAASWAM
jgi:hypothetical protein